MDKGYEEISKSLMLELLYENGYIDRENPESKQVSQKWLAKIAPIAGEFFDKHPDLLTDENIEIMANGGEIGDPNEAFKEYPDIKPLMDILNEYFDADCGCS